MSCSKGYMKQYESGRHTHVEQPSEAESWKTEPLKDLPGYDTKCDQCRFGLGKLLWDGGDQFVREFG